MDQIASKNKIIKCICRLLPELPKNNDSKTNKTCYMVCNDSLFLIANPKYVVAKVFSNFGCKVEVLTNKYNDTLKELADTYGLKSSYVNRMPFYLMLDALFKSIRIILFLNAEKLERYKMDNILIGDLIYDSVLRTNDGVFTLKSVRNIATFKQAIKAMMIYNFCKYKFRNRPDYLIVQDLVYVDDIYSRIAYALGAKLIVMTTGRPSFVYGDESEFPTFDNEYKHEIEMRINSLDEGWEQAAENELNMLFSGQGDWNVQNAYSNKETSTKEAVKKELGIANESKNIVIMAHCFSDAPHCTESTLFQDYYVWLEETLKYTKENKKVNWILKAHPGRSHYGEDGVVEELLKKYKHDCLYWFPDKYSTLVLIDFADAIITVSGSAGYELSCLGIPCICAGKPFYSYFGYTINPKNKEEYKQILADVHNLDKLTPEQITNAKKVFLIFKDLFHLNDEFARKSLELHSRFCITGDIEDINKEYVNLLEEQIEEHRISDMYDVRFAQSI